MHAKLNYRKFQWWNTQFAFGGVPDPHSTGDVTADHDDRKWNFNGDLSHVSSNRPGIPDLPVVTVAEDSKSLRVLPKSAAAPTAQVVLAKEDWTRWNDYGIGLFLQGDLKGAEQAFTTITKIDPHREAPAAPGSLSKRSAAISIVDLGLLSSAIVSCSL